jgi:formate dehydrogenase assembly factor FdhD
MSNRALAAANPASTAKGQAVDCPGLRWAGGAQSAVRERLVVEEPLAIEIAYERLGQAVTRVLSVTMRTPGEDAELALGFLYCESVIDRAQDVLGGESYGENSRGEKIATWRVRLAQAPGNQAVERVSRGIITSAACGLCGRTSLEGLRLGVLPVTPDLRWQAKRSSPFPTSCGVSRAFIPRQEVATGPGCSTRPASPWSYVRTSAGTTRWTR